MLVLKANYFAVCGASRLLEAMLAHVDRSRVEPVLVEVATDGMPSSIHFASPRLASLRHETIAWRGARHSRTAIEALRELVQRTGAGLVYAHDMRCDLLCRLARGRRGLGVPWVAHVHGWAGPAGDLRLRLFERIDRWCVRNADAVLVGSQHAVRDVRASLPASVPIRCLENTIDPVQLGDAMLRAADARRALGLPEGAFAVGMHARLHHAKGHRELALAVMKSRHDDVHAVLLGQGPEEANLRALAADPRARGRVHVVGPQRPEDLLASVAGLDLLAYASLRESLPLAVLEAMHLARPIVSTAVGDVPSVLEHGAAGVLVPPGDVDAMAHAIDALRTDPARRTALAHRALEVARTRFSPERLGRDVTDALLAIAGGRS